MMRSCLLAVALLSGSAAGAVLYGRGHTKGFLSSGLQPQVVAQSLFAVQDKWRAEAADFAECSGGNATASDEACATSQEHFEHSCSTVATAVLKGSSGNRANVQEYMVDVCGQDELKGWHQESCRAFAAEIDGAMTDDVYANREEVDTVKLCRHFWGSFLGAERERVAAERAEREAEEKKAAEERAAAEKQAAEEAAEAEKKAAEEAAKRAAEEKKHAAEEKARLAAEAKAKAEEAAANLAAKRAEAEHEAEEAQKKMEEATAAAEESKQRQAEANRTLVEAQQVQTAAALAVNGTQVAAVQHNSSFVQTQGTCPQTKLWGGFSEDAAGTIQWRECPYNGVANVCHNVGMVVTGKVKFCGPGKLTISRMSCERMEYKAQVFEHSKTEYTTNCEEIDIKGSVVDGWVGSFKLEKC